MSHYPWPGTIVALDPGAKCGYAVYHDGLLWEHGVSDGPPIDVISDSWSWSREHGSPFVMVVMSGHCDFLDLDPDLEDCRK